MTKIKVLGTGCAKCKALTQNVKAAIKELALRAEVEKIEDIREILRFGVMSMPALVVNGEVKISGRVPSVTELKGLLK